MIGPFTEWHFLPMMAPTAILTGIGRIHFDQSSASFFRFAEELIKECRPRCITHAFGETVVMEHPIHMQILHADETKLVHDPTGVLVREVVSTPRDPLMHTGNNLTMLASLSTALNKLAVFALDFSQGLLLFTEETGILDFLTRGKRGEGFETHINTDGIGIVLQPFGFAFAGEAHIPLASRGLRDGGRLDGTTYGSVVDHLHRTNLGEAHTVIMGDAKA